MDGQLRSELQTERLALSGWYRPADHLGGDYYDYLPLDEGRLGVIISDVSGHDPVAARPVTAARGILHGQMDVGHDPRAVLALMQDVLAVSVSRMLLMSCCYVLLDTRRRLLRYANAGHPWPLHYRRQTGDLRPLMPLNAILGAEELAVSDFVQLSRPWNPGDVLVLYTDGVSEARNPLRESFDTGLLEQCVIEHADASAAEIREAIIAALYRHASSHAFVDDLTLVVVKAI